MIYALHGQIQGHSPRFIDPPKKVIKNAINCKINTRTPPNYI